MDMDANAEYHGQPVRITTEHAASSYGLPVMLLDGALLDATRGGEAEDIAICLMGHGATVEIRDAARVYLNAMPPMPAGSIGAFGVDFSGDRYNYALEGRGA